MVYITVTVEPVVLFQTSSAKTDPEKPVPVIGFPAEAVKPLLTIEVMLKVDAGTVTLAFIVTPEATPEHTSAVWLFK